MDIGFAFAIGAAITWGLNYVILEKVLSSISPLLLLFFSSILTIAILSPFVFLSDDFRKADFAVFKAHLPLILLTAILASLANFMILSSIKRLDASTASVIEISYPFFVILFSYLFFRSVPNLAFFIGGIMVFAGTFIIIKYA